GIDQADERLAGLVARAPAAHDLVPSHADAARRLATLWGAAPERLPVVALTGADEPTRRGVASAGCAALSLRLLAGSADLLPSGAAELEALAGLLEREAALTSAALYLDADTIDPTDGRLTAPVARLLERLNGPVVLSTAERWRAPRRPTSFLEIGKPTRGE